MSSGGSLCAVSAGCVMCATCSNAAARCFHSLPCAVLCGLLQDPRDAVANTVRSGSAQVDVVWRPVGLSHRDFPDVIAGPLTSKPLVLLVNGNTASASEVLAGEEALSRIGGQEVVGSTACIQRGALCAVTGGCGSC
jgi:hypothetical protein